VATATWMPGTRPGMTEMRLSGRPQRAIAGVS
jgi:hypothetical protein